MVNTQGKRFIRKLLCAYLAIVIICLPGCSSDYSQVLDQDDHEVISKTQSQFSKMANHSDLPVMYINEGKVGVSRVQATMEIANSDDMHARAKMDQQLADFNARRIEVNAEVNKALSKPKRSANSAKRNTPRLTRRSRLVRPNWTH